MSSFSKTQSTFRPSVLSRGPHEIFSGDAVCSTLTELLPESLRATKKPAQVDIILDMPEIMSMLTRMGSANVRQYLGEEALEKVFTFCTSEKNPTQVTDLDSDEPNLTSLHTNAGPG